MADDDFAWFDAQLKKERMETPPPEGRRWNERGQPVFAPGVKQPAGSVKGRKGSRNKLATQFFTDLHALWEEQGESILRRAAFEEPVAFAAIVAKLMPQKIEISDTTMQDMEAERLERILEFTSRVIEQRGLDPLALESHRGESETAQPGKIEILPPLSQAARVPREG